MTKEQLKQMSKDEIIDEAREVIYSLCIQYMDRGHGEHGLFLDHRFMSAGEDAYEFMGWPYPKYIPENECDFEGCHEEERAGLWTIYGYLSVCSKHAKKLRDKGELMERDVVLKMQKGEK